MYKNLFAVLLGIFCSFVGLIFFIQWLNILFIETKRIPLMKIQKILLYNTYKFYIILLIFYIISIILGCSMTAYIVLHAKTAYSILTGSIMICINFFLWIFPIWFKIIIIPIIFQLAYLSGEFITFVTKTKLN
ncbi:hypothetical protein [Blattabacterium cuenoti]|uniref:hypothetical protein n=1 Tax=Blattabacterium cuenoti TaxID=1653831 RepID=UPI00163B6E9B|nr:hypothetical protein [Blattabacterium cuenoti]